jgi:isocitrate dehydrogenase kinase/phosphatase
MVSGGPHDVFPEEFGTFLLGDPLMRKTFLKYHRELLDAGSGSSVSSASRMG